MSFYLGLNSDESPDAALLVAIASAAFVLFLVLVVLLVFFAKRTRRASAGDVQREKDGKISYGNGGCCVNGSRCPPTPRPRLPQGPQLEGRGAAFVNMGCFPHSITKVKIPSYSQPSSSSSSDNESGSAFRSLPHCVPQTPGSKFGSGSFFVGQVQPINEHHKYTTASSQSHTSSTEETTAQGQGDEDKEPNLTFSLSLHVESEKLLEDSVVTASSPSLPGDFSLNLKLIKAVNLERSSLSAGPRIASAFRASRPGGTFLPEGVIARIFKRVDVRKGNLSRQSSAEQEPGSSSVCNSSDNEFKQTPMIKSRKSKTIKFSEEPLVLRRSEFPLRLTLYDVDRHLVRFSLGHCIVDITDSDNFSTDSEVILTRRLYPTIYKAKNSMTK